MNPYSVPTSEERQQMLAAVGLTSTDELFAEIPESIRIAGKADIPKGKSEYEALQELKDLAAMNRLGTSFLGCGSYDRIIPSAVSQLASLPTFVTSYTPYQPEVSQGTLQAMFEYQSMICELTGLDVTNASLYDGHTAAAEALMIAGSVKRRGRVMLLSRTVHPHTLAVIRTHLIGSDFEIRLIPEKNGLTDFDALEKMIDGETAGVLVQSPNIYGTLEDFTGVADLVHAQKGLFIISCDPMSLGLVKTPAEWGADIAVGDLQPFGISSSFGGPSAGFITAEEKLLRKLPGRIVGESVDTGGKRAFVLTLQAREQHIKRERATSNICSNQAHAALTSAIYMALVGFAGIREAALQSRSKAAYLRKALAGMKGISLYSEGEQTGEFTLAFPNLEAVHAFMDHLRRDHGIFAGVCLGDLDPELGPRLTVAVTEKRTKAELDAYIKAAGEVLA